MCFIQGTRPATKELEDIMSKLASIRNSRIRINFNGYWELDHSSYDGGIENRDYIEVKNWFTLINAMNTAITKNNKK